FPAETQSRRDKRRENQERQDLKARMAGGIRLCLVHPSAARTSFSSFSAPFILHGLCFSALISASPRLCGESGSLGLRRLPSPIINPPATHIFPNLAEKVSVRQDAGARI